MSGKEIDRSSGIGVGATGKLSLRVSVGSLVSVLFTDPESGQTLLALERAATLQEIEGREEIVVRAKPFGGAVRITDPSALTQLIGDFHYDSERSRQEADFRILIHPASWERVKEVCRRHTNTTGERILDPDPRRELAEEFAETLQVRLRGEDYRLFPCGARVEEPPLPAENVRAAGLPTVWFYYLFVARVEAPQVAAAMLASSRRYSDRDLQEMAREDARQGGRGRANAVLTLAPEDLKDAHRLFMAGKRGAPIQIGGHQLDRTVLALLEGMSCREAEA